MSKIEIIHDSSVINAVQYIDDKKEMRIRFTSGKIYRYVEFPKDVFERLVNESKTGGSVGQFYNASIKRQFPAMECGSFVYGAQDDVNEENAQQAEKRFYDELQAAIVVKGGRKMELDELQQLSMAEFWNMARGGLRLKVELV